MMIIVALLLILIATVCDLRKREVPDWISIALLLAAIIATTLRVGETGWLGLAVGLALGLAIGTALFAWCGLGGGDAKLIVALGAVFGPLGLLSLLFWTALAGAGLAVVAHTRGQRDLAYVPAIALGLLVHVVIGTEQLGAFLMRTA